MSTKLFHSIYSYASKLECDRPRKNLLEEIKNKIRKIDIFSAIYINIKVVTTTNSKFGLQRSLQNLMLDFSTKKNLKSVKNSAQKMILNLVFLSIRDSPGVELLIRTTWSPFVRCFLGYHVKWVCPRALWGSGDTKAQHHIEFLLSLLQAVGCESTRRQKNWRPGRHVNVMLSWVLRSD